MASRQDSDGPSQHMNGEALSGERATSFSQWNTPSDIRRLMQRIIRLYISRHQGRRTMFDTLKISLIKALLCFQSACLTAVARDDDDDDGDIATPKTSMDDGW